MGKKNRAQEGLDAVFPAPRMLITSRGDEQSLQQPDTAQLGDPMPIGAWPFSRALCQRCQLDGRFWPK